jgi:hypothetical protein
MTIDFKALGQLAAAEGKDMTQASVGGEYTPPAAGPCRLRFIAYVELGKQKGTFQGKETVREKAILTFELSGKNHPPAIKEDGSKEPIRISIEENLSLNEKAHFFKIFTRMNHSGTARHIVELLGNAYKGEVVHDKWKDKTGKERTTATLRGADGYTVQPARIEDDEVDGGWRVLEVAPAISPLKCFLWDYATTEQWASIFLEGEFPEKKKPDGTIIPAKSKNIFQNRIKGAVNFHGSPMYNLLVSNGVTIDIPEVGEDMDDVPDFATKTQPKPANDALGGIV